MVCINVCWLSGVCCRGTSLTVLVVVVWPDIEVDGGLKPATIDMAAKAGANMIVSGSGIFKAENMALNISTMRRSIEQHGNGRKGEELSPLVQ